MGADPKVEFWDGFSRHRLFNGGRKGAGESDGIKRAFPNVNVPIADAKLGFCRRPNRYLLNFVCDAQ